MATEGVEHRLAGILGSNVVGYSHLVGRDGERINAGLQALRDDLIDSGITGHDGRIEFRNVDIIIYDLGNEVMNVLRVG